MEEKKIERIWHAAGITANIIKYADDEFGLTPILWECSCKWTPNINKKEIFENAKNFLKGYLVDGAVVEENFQLRDVEAECFHLATKLIHLTFAHRTQENLELKCSKRIQRFKVNGEFLYDISCLPEEWRTSTVIKKFREFGINTF